MKSVFFFMISYIFISSCSSIRPSDRFALQKTIRQNGVNHWEIFEEDGFTLYMLKGSGTYIRKSETIQKVGLGLEKAMLFLDQPYVEPIKIVVLDNKEMLYQLTNRQSDGFVLPASNAVIEVANVSNLCHEKFHLISMNSWGVPKHWINEGMAVACDQEWWGVELHPLANYLQIHNKAISLKTMVRSNASFRKTDSRFSYPQAGSIIQYIDEEYGRESLLKLWNGESFEKTLGKSLLEFEVEWKNEIEKYSTRGINYLEKIKGR